MRANLYLFFISTIVIALGLVLPWALIDYTVKYGLSAWISISLSVLGIILAGIIGIVGISTYEDLDYSTSSSEDILREKIKYYRARQRAMLEDLDEIIVVLKDIAGILESAGGD